MRHPQPFFANPVSPEMRWRQVGPSNSHRNAVQQASCAAPAPPRVLDTQMLLRAQHIVAISKAAYITNLAPPTKGK